MRKHKNQASKTFRIGETIVMSTDKKAALLFDRIWVPPEHAFDFPEEVLFSDETSHKTILKLFKRYGEEAIYEESLNSLNTRKSDNFTFEGTYVRAVVEGSAKHGINIVPLFDSEKLFSSGYPRGSFLSHLAALESISIVSGEDLPWKQILDFRKDKNAVMKYRSLSYWLKYGLEANSLEEAVNIIEKKIYDYNWAIKKHELKTVTGTISNILSSKCFTTLAAGSGIAGLAGGTMWAALSAGLIAISQSSIYVSERMIDYEDITRGDNSEIALIHEIRRKIKP